MKRKHYNHILFVSAMCFVWIIFFYPIYDAIKGRGIDAVLTNSLRSFYLPHFNSFPVGEISGINIYLYAHGFFFCLFLMLYYLQHYWLKKNAFTRYLNPKMIASGLLIVMIFVQTASRLIYFDAEFRYYITKDNDQRLSSFFRGLHAFARQCRDVLPGAHNAEFISDLDLNKEVPGKFTYWSLSYYLYPIDIKDIHFQKRKDCVIVFSGNDPQRLLPADVYEGIHLIGQEGLVAVRKQ